MKNTQQKQKKIPERRCTGCGESFPKRELIRVVRSPEGEVSIDFTGKKSGISGVFSINDGVFGIFDSKFAFVLFYGNGKCTYSENTQQ